MTPDLNLGDTRLIIREAEAAGLLRNQLAYVLATAYHETARTMKPVEEAFYLGRRAEAYRKKLRYYPWHGRGYVQITHRANYEKAGKALDIDLTTDPDAAMVPEVAAKVLVRGMVEGWFTGKKLSDYITLERSGFIGARRIINGTDKASTIAGLARDYDAALKAEGYGGSVSRVPADAAGRELYALIDRPFHTLTEAEWGQWQARWRALFAAAQP